MQVQERSADFLVIGAGIAGLRAAIALAAHARVLIATKENFGESNTSYAQGGIAVAVGGADDVQEHSEDTISAGDGLVDPIAASILVREGPLRFEELLGWDTRFDRAGDGTLLLGREGAHSRNRILHANGDATGAEIGRALLAHARTHPRIEFLEWTTCTHLLQDANGRVVGATLLDRDATLIHATAPAVLLASGGAGQVYSDTTNPAVATGDGIAAAWRAGAVIADMEFYQFHPTALSIPGLPRFLLSEALRGEGAFLRNDAGERFMERYHPLLELAPRDVVARAITQEGMPATPGAPSRLVHLDMRHVEREHPGLRLDQRFPGISAFLASHGLSLAADLIPVRPAAHYLMGGVLTDVYGRTSLPGLYAAGEVACTGVHGANRLASNSLLEGLVFGARAAEAMLGDANGGGTPVPAGHAHGAGDPALRNALRAEMWNNAGLLRNREGLQRAADALGSWRDGQRAVAGSSVQQGPTRAGAELGSLLDVAGLVVRSALAREESRGAHYRGDHPRRDDAGFRRHSLVAGNAAVGYSADVTLAQPQQALPV